MDTDRDILISGASVAGPALAWWLSRYGFRPTVVERAPRLRGGGYAVDFRGAVHLGVLAKMGILDAVKARQTNLTGTTIVDPHGRPVAQMPAHVFAGDVEILRGDLAEILHEATQDSTEYLFGDSVTRLDQRPGGVDVSFSRAPPRTFSLVIGADGLHSNVRRLAFGEHGRFIEDLGLCVSIFSLPGPAGPGHAGLLCSMPGRTAGVFSAGDNRAIAQLYFAAPGVSYGHRERAEQQQVVAEAFTGMGWRVPQLLAAMAQAPDFYFDTVSQVHLDSWSAGRVALLGDAACAAGPGGNGTGNAVVGAYVLAGELAAAGGDHQAAFARYQQLIRPYVAKGQKQARGSKDFLAPATAKKIAQVHRFYKMLPYLPTKHLMKHLTTRTATSIKLPDYPAPERPRGAAAWPDGAAFPAGKTRRTT
jgi:2-polyprenyl-6-methoxyphenol hydroxylase-like FAD-dependent oxidoreductase